MTNDNVLLVLGRLPPGSSLEIDHCMAGRERWVVTYIPAGGVLEGVHQDYWGATLQAALAKLAAELPDE